MINLPRTIPADATVKRIAGLVGGGGGIFIVTVTLPLKPGFYRRYQIQAYDDNGAAAEGLRRFEDEHSQMPKLLIQ